MYDLPTIAVFTQALSLSLSSAMKVKGALAMETY